MTCQLPGTFEQDIWFAPILTRLVLKVRVISQKPHTGFGAVMCPDSLVDFGAV